MEPIQKNLEELQAQDHTRNRRMGACAKGSVSNFVTARPVRGSILRWAERTAEKGLWLCNDWSWSVF